MQKSLLEFKTDRLRAIELLASCPVCQSRLSRKNALVVYDTEDHFLIHVDCLECLGSAILSVKKDRAKSKNLITVSMTDLTKNDIRYFKDKANLTSNEVLSVHRFFKNNQLI